MEDISHFRQVIPAHLPSLPIDQRHALPDVPAVYFTLGGANQVLYIGRAVSLNGRWKAHHRLTELQHIGNVRLAWIELESKEFLDEAEQVLIEHFSPVLNGQEVNWDKAPVMLRIKPDDLERIDRVAKRIGLKRAAFILSSAIERAAKMDV